MSGEQRTEPERVARIDEAFEIWNSQGIEAFAQSRWRPDVVWEEARGFPEAGVRHGREACVGRMLERFEALGHVSVEVVEAKELSATVAIMELIIRGRGQASGAPTEMRDWIISEIDDEGMTARMWEFLDGEEAARAADALVMRPDC